MPTCSRCKRNLPELKTAKMCENCAYSPDRWAAIKANPELLAKRNAQKRDLRKRRLEALLNDPAIDREEKARKLKAYTRARESHEVKIAPKPAYKTVDVEETSDDGLYDTIDPDWEKASFNQSISDRWAKGEHITDICKDLGIHGVRGYKAIEGLLPPDMDEQIKAMFLGGSSDYKIAAHFRVHREGIKKRIKRMGLNGTRARPIHPDQMLPAEESEVCSRYLALESMASLSKAYGRPEGTIRRCLVRNGIALRSAQEQWEISTRTTC